MFRVENLEYRDLNNVSSRKLEMNKQGLLDFWLFKNVCHI